MAVGVDEAGDEGLALAVDLGRGVLTPLLVGADTDDPPACDGDELGPRPAPVEGEDIGIVQAEVCLHDGHRALSRCTMRMAQSAGVTPSMREAWPSVCGRRALSFCRAS